MVQAGAMNNVTEEGIIVVAARALERLLELV
jgi:hypothetical protein